jgi:Insulinase (Peptidase family M16)
VKFGLAHRGSLRHLVSQVTLNHKHISAISLSAGRLATKSSLNSHYLHRLQLQRPLRSLSAHRIGRGLATMATNEFQANKRVEVLSSNVEKPELDDRTYRLIRLPDNKLEALLVHDPNTDKSSAAMDVHVGHLSDPKDFPGLAHALEHCLFLGISLPSLCLLTFFRYKEVSRGE